MRGILHVGRNQHSELRRQTERASVFPAEACSQRTLGSADLIQTSCLCLSFYISSTPPLPKILGSSLLANVPVIPDCNL